MNTTFATTRQLEVGQHLAAVASDAEFTYTPTGQVYKDSRGGVWHQMHTDHHPDGRSWTYYLARDSGSYRGSFMDWDGG